MMHRRRRLISIRLPGGEYFRLLSSRLTSTWVISTRSIGTSGMTGSILNDTSLVPHARLQGSQGASDQILHIARLKVQPDRAGLDAGHVQQVADKAIQTLRLAAGGLQQFPARLVT